MRCDALGYDPAHELKMSLAPGTRIGSYEVISMVGAGGMGEVYRARDVKLNRVIAFDSLEPILIPTHLLPRTESEEVRLLQATGALVLITGRLTAGGLERPRAPQTPAAWSKPLYRQ
jgi:hypothetical protein